MSPFYLSSFSPKSSYTFKAAWKMWKYRMKRDSILLLWNNYQNFLFNIFWFYTKQSLLQYWKRSAKVITCLQYFTIFWSKFCHIWIFFLSNFSWKELLKKFVKSNLWAPGKLRNSKNERETCFAGHQVFSISLQITH